MIPGALTSASAKCLAWVDAVPVGIRQQAHHLRACLLMAGLELVRLIGW